MSRDYSYITSIPVWCWQIDLKPSLSLLVSLPKNTWLKLKELTKLRKQDNHTQERVWENILEQFERIPESSGKFWNVLEVSGIVICDTK